MSKSYTFRPGRHCLFHFFPGKATLRAYEYPQTSAGRGRCCHISDDLSGLCKSLRLLIWNYIHIKSLRHLYRLCKCYRLRDLRDDSPSGLFCSSFRYDPASLGLLCSLLRIKLHYGARSEYRNYPANTELHHLLYYKIHLIRLWISLKQGNLHRKLCKVIIHILDAAQNLVSAKLRYTARIISSSAVTDSYLLTHFKAENVLYMVNVSACYAYICSYISAIYVYKESVHI